MVMIRAPEGFEPPFMAGGYIGSALRFLAQNIVKILTAAGIMVTGWKIIEYAEEREETKQEEARAYQKEWETKKIIVEQLPELMQQIPYEERGRFLELIYKDILEARETQKVMQAQTVGLVQQLTGIIPVVIIFLIIMLILGVIGKVKKVVD